jgi:Spy/CpxP family protein refolding chaperone
MRQTLKALAGGVALSLLLGVAVAWAQAATSEGPQQGRPRAVRAAGDFLGLTDRQRAAFEEIRERERPQMEALHEEARAAREELRQALEAASPDPMRVGELAIEEHRLREALRTLREEADKELRAVLTPEQQVKFDAMRALRHARGPMGPPPGMGGPRRLGPEDEAPPRP